MFYRNLVNCLFVLLLTMFCATSFAAEEYDVINQKFFSLMEENKTGEAIDYLFSGNPWISQIAPDRIDTLKMQMTNLRKIVGSLKGEEQLLEEKIGTHNVYIVYIGLYERQPIRFKFLYYRPDGKWRCQNFSFDTGFPEDLEKIADRKLISGAR